MLRYECPSSLSSVLWLLGEETRPSLLSTLPENLLNLADALIQLGLSKLLCFVTRWVIDLSFKRTLSLAKDATG